MEEGAKEGAEILLDGRGIKVEGREGRGRIGRRKGGREGGREGLRGRGRVVPPEKGRRRRDRKRPTFVIYTLL
jgi:hypothetical protein